MVLVLGVFRREWRFVWQVVRYARTFLHFEQEQVLVTHNSTTSYVRVSSFLYILHKVTLFTHHCVLDTTHRVLGVVRCRVASQFASFTRDDIVRYTFLNINSIPRLYVSFMQKQIKKTQFTNSDYIPLGILHFFFLDINFHRHFLISIIFLSLYFSIFFHYLSILQKDFTIVAVSEIDSGREAVHIFL